MKRIALRTSWTTRRNGGLTAGLGLRFPIRVLDEKTQKSCLTFGIRLHLILFTIFIDVNYNFDDENKAGHPKCKPDDWFRPL